MATKRGRPRKSPENLFGRGVVINDQARSIVLHIYNHYKKLQTKTKLKGAFQKTIDATGVPSSSLAEIIKDDQEEKSHVPPKKRYKVSRKTIVTDDFDKDAIRRKIYSMYEPEGACCTF